MEASADSTVPDPRGSAADGNGLGFADHAVEHLDSEGDLAVLGRSAAGTELGPDQVLVAAHRRFGMVAYPVPGGALPADAAAVGHVWRTPAKPRRGLRGFDELDVTVARGLLIRISCVQHGIGPGWDDHLGRRPRLSGSGGLVDGIAIVGAVRGDAGPGPFSSDYWAPRASS